LIDGLPFISYLLRLGVVQIPHIHHTMILNPRALGLSEWAPKFT
jgi:hypothetical protein